MPNNDAEKTSENGHEYLQKNLDYFGQSKFSLMFEREKRKMIGSLLIISLGSCFSLAPSFYPFSSSSEVHR